ncbi:MAG: SLATT domain-containing protein [Verrucomicrobia bacterium]|nr:MAG: SLATT domain-containing protein [Verrucomicrobiota bacterium]
MSTPEQILDDWYIRVAVTQRAHYLSADHFGKLKYWLGIPAVVLSTLVGTSLFATLQKQPEPRLQIAVGLASVAAALLASLQTFLGYSDRAEKHRVAGAKYGALGRELEQLRASSITPTPEAISEVRKRLDDLAMESPNNPLPIYRKAGSSSLEPKRDGA